MLTEYLSLNIVEENGKIMMLNPENMTVIINIQMMNKHINADYNPVEDFHRLRKWDLEKLRDEQNRLIPEYNKTIKKKEE